MNHPALAATGIDPNLELTLKVLPAVIVILIVSALCGLLATRLWQPRVLGEMVAGVLLGPTLFGWLFPDVQAKVFPPEVTPILYVLSTIGLTLYMFLVGAGMEHGGSGPRQPLHQPAMVAVAGILPVMVLGMGAGLLLWGTLSDPGISRWFFAAFLGGALSLTAFPMLARILYERGLENSPLGKLSLMAGGVDDAVAWCILAILTAIHIDSGSGGAARTIGLALLFAVLMLTVVSRLLRTLGRHVLRSGQISNGTMYLVILVPLTAGWLTDWIGIYSVFGGFIAGLAMPRDAAFRRMLHGRMMDVVSTLLLPIFFAFSGLNTRLDGLGGGTMFLAFLAILLVGFVGKYFGCSLAMRSLGFGWRESYAVGALMNARGLMILIFINIGLAQGMIGQQTFSILVLVAVLTTAAALPLYKLALPDRLERAQRNEPLKEPRDHGLAAGASEEGSRVG
ncbi:cation:proton antiporter [Actinomadura sp. 7K507]|uniref:cation:proton antiporter n=1 Tax=Actinomadura sp. 7K507 TaxID=2530365 RepID=UPI00104F9622|nr:cation:proton antiporter [Actinomadura sp. 7K507]TDC98395.1 transporter [Actinomadura sp. 7K507]